VYSELMLRFGSSSVENVMSSHADRIGPLIDERVSAAFLKLDHSVKFINDTRRVAQFVLFSSAGKGTTSISWSRILTVVDNRGATHVHLCSDIFLWFGFCCILQLEYQQL
jgi:hypothetical protein